MRFKRGQLTLFLIVGMVLIIIFAFLFFAVQTVSKTQLENQVNQIFQQIVSSTSLNYYVSLCAQQALEDGLKAIGDQGGKIFEEQGGPFSKQASLVFSTDKNYDVAYLIQRDRGVNILPPPEYPCRASETDPTNACFNGCCFTYPPSSSEFYTYSISLIPPLCKTDSDCGFEATACQPNVPYCIPRSIQGQLESYVSNRTKECVDINSIVGINTTYSIEEGNVTTNISLGDSDVSATVSFPILIRLSSTGQPFARFAKFSATVPARLKRMYQIVEDSVKQNNERLDFDILTQINESAAYSSDFQITKFNDVHNYDDVYRINDTKPSTFSFFFQFAIENRNPVLNYVGKGTVDQCGNIFDVAVRENSSMNITPQGLDQDFDNVTYEYVSGWKITNNETYQPQTTQCPSTTLASTTILTNTNEWESSQDFIDTKKTASVFVNEGEIGLHNITIKINDSEFEDWQIVKIFVYAILKASGRINNSYSDLQTVCPNCTSFEDPFTLTAEVFGGVPGSGFDYKWTDLTNNNQVLYGPGSLAEITISDVIKNIKQTIQSSYLGTILGPHTIRLDVTNSESASSDKAVKVYDCLPHRSNDPPYPYNTTSDPFAGNHTCCSDAGSPNGNFWGIYLQPDPNFIFNVCYRKDTYGPPAGFDDNKYFDNDFDSSNPPTPSITWLDKTGNSISNPTSSPYDNDIFNRSFRRECSGDRGNVCGGDVDEQRKQLQDCNDNRYNTAGTLRCSGPSLFSEQESAQQCINYSGTTYEAQIGTGSNICNAALACTDGTSYNVNGPKKCQATCTGSGTDEGKCLTAASSTCSCDSSCGAECTGSGQYNWAGFTCKYGTCQSNCNFQSSATTKCTAGTANCLNTADSKCYTLVGCSSSGAASTAKDYCPTAGKISRFNNSYLAPVPGLVNWCFYGTQGCTSAGKCTLGQVNTTVIRQLPPGCNILQISETAGLACFNTTTLDCYHTNSNPCGNPSTGWYSPTLSTCNSGQTCTVNGCQ